MAFLTHHMLVALPALQDPDFARSVALICQHDGNGAMGVVVNRPSEYTLGDVLAQMGIVLVDQDACRGWRQCITGCPYKKIYYNHKTGKAEKCTFCYPRVEVGIPTVCAETCVGRMRYIGIFLYDADRVTEAAATPEEKDLYEAQLDLMLDPNDPEVQRQARADGIPDDWMEAARKSPVYKLAKELRVALPLHPEYRTMPMVWYIPPLSPIQDAADAGAIGTLGGVPDIGQLRIPVRYLANLLTAGDEAPVRLALRKLLALRAYMRARNVEDRRDPGVLADVGLAEAQAEVMYRVMAIANYEDRFVIPTAHKEVAANAYDQRGIAGFHFSQTSSEGNSRFVLWGQDTRKTRGERFPMEKK